MLRSERKRVAAFMQRLYAQGLTTTSGGNISVRATGQRIVLTPTHTDKGAMSAEDVGVIGADGTNLTPRLKPSIEAELHLRVYRRNSDVNAIVHAHPVTATAFTATGRQINTRLICEPYAIVGEPVPAGYACMGTDELAETVASATERGTTVIMSNHGVLTTGGTLLQAFNRMEVLEAAAKQTVIMELIGDARPLSAEKLNALDQLMGRC